MTMPPTLPQRPNHPGTLEPGVSEGTRNFKENGQHVDDANYVAYDLEDKVSTILFVRQFDLYHSPLMNEANDLFVMNESFEESLKSRIEAKQGLGNGEGDDDKHRFWFEVINDYEKPNKYIGEASKIEKQIVEGIPNDLRFLVYLKVLRVKYKINKENYNTLLRKAINSTSTQSLYRYVDSLVMDKGLKEILQIFNYYTNEVSYNAAKMEAINSESTGVSPVDCTLNLPPSSFVIHVSKLVYGIPNLTHEEVLFILLKLNKLFANVTKDEFLYKINRTLEDSSHEAFVHINKQGINLNTVYKRLLFTFFDGQISDERMLLLILDFIVFEGFDFVTRLLLHVFSINSEAILQLEGDEVLEFLNSSKFFAGLNAKDQAGEFKCVGAKILQTDLPLIKYENEFYLIYANSLNSNNNELANLKEVNDDLVIKVNELKSQFESLKNTHLEILSQADEFYQQLNQEQERNQELTSAKEQLIEKYENLSMKENVKNTIKANKEFSSRNQDLERQIQELKVAIEEKKTKLPKAPTTSSSSSMS